MEFDKTKWSCPGNRDENCTQNSARGQRGSGGGGGQEVVGVRMWWGQGGGGGHWGRGWWESGE